MCESHLEYGDGTDRDQDDDSDVHFGREPPAVVGVVVLIVLLRMVQHVVVVPPGVLILHAQKEKNIYFWLSTKVCPTTSCR